MPGELLGVGGRANKPREITQAVADSSRHTRAGPQGRRPAHKAGLVAFCAHFSYLCSQASKYEWLGMKINLELKGGKGCFILGGFTGCPSAGTARTEARAQG